MSEQSRRLSIYVNLDTGQLERSSEQAKNTLKGIGNEAEVQGKRMASVFKNAGVAIVAAFAVQRIKSFISEIINVRSEIQSLSVSFETLLGNKQKADALMAQIRTYAANTPMQMNDLAQGAQTLLGFNVEAKKVMPILRSIGDISMGNAMRFNSLTLAFAQMSAAGKLMGQDLLQMTNAGFNPLIIISEKTGKAMSTLKDEMSAGSISAQMVEDAFRAATAEGGKFHGMLEAQSKTLRGSLSNLRGAFADMLNDFGESSEGLIAGGVNAAYQMVKNYKETAEALMALIATIGVYKAAIIANEAIEAAAIDTLHAKMASIAEVQAAQATGLELEVQQAVAKGVLTKADAEEILANFELAKARVADLNAIKIHTQAEEKAAIIARNLAAANVQAAEAQVTAANMKYEAALRSGNGEKIERAELALGTAQSELNAASKAHQAALTDVATASKKASAAATAADTAQQELNTISLQNNSKATGFLTLAKTQLRGAVAKLYATMTAHPLAILLAAVVALGYGIYKLCTYETDAEKAQKRLNESFAEAQAAAATERMEIDRLFDKLKKAKEGTEAYKKAKEDIWSKYGNYLKALGDENTALKDQAAAYALVAKKAREAAMAKYKAEWMDKEGKATQDKLTNTYKKVKELITEKYGEDYYLRHAAEFARIIRGDTDVNPEFLKAFNKVTEHTSYHRSTGTYTTWTTTSNKLADYIADGKKAMSEFNDMVTEAEALFGAAKDPGDGATDPEDTKLYNTELKQAKATMDKAKKEWQNLKKSTTATVKQVQDAEKAYESAKKRYEELSGKKNEDKGKTEAEKAADRAAALRKETDLTIDQIRERREAILKYEAELEQARIDILEDGAEKRLRQRELDMANDIADLRSRMQQEIDNEVARQKAAFDAQEEANAAGKKHYAKKTFDSGDILVLKVNPGKSIAADANTGNVDTKAINQIIALYGVLNNLLLRKHKNRISDEQTAERLAMDEYLRQYGTMQEKREAIDRIYAERKSKATSQGEAMQIQQEWNAALNDIEFDDFVQNRAALAFGEVENLSNATIGELIDELEKYRSKVVATFDPEKISKYEEALSRLKKAQAMNADNPLSAFIPEYFKEKKAAQAELNAAEKTSSDLAAEKLKKEEELSGKVDEIIAKTKELAGIELTVAQVKNGAALQKVIDGFISKALETDNDDEKTRFNAIAIVLPKI